MTDPTYRFSVRRGEELGCDRKIVRLPTGKQGPVGADCLRIEEQPESKYRLTASAMCTGKDDSESLSIVDIPLFDSATKAEAAGMAWAMNVGYERLYISSGTLDTPLEPLEFDMPL